VSFNIACSPKTEAKYKMLIFSLKRPAETKGLADQIIGASSDASTGWYNGHGDNLIDYNHNNHHIAIGLLMIEWL